MERSFSSKRSCESSSSRKDINENGIRQHKKNFDIVRQQSCEASSCQASEVARLASRQKRLSKYEDEAKKYQEKEKDHRPCDFEKDFETNIEYKKGIFYIVSKNNHVKYENAINISEGQIIGCWNDSKDTRSWHLSDIIYNQLLFVLQKAKKDISQFDLKSWYGNNITNKNTKDLVKYLLGYKNLQEFKAGSKEFNEIAVSDTAQSKFFLLAQYPKAFKGKKVTSITVIRHSDGQIDIEYKFGSSRTS